MEKEAGVRRSIRTGADENADALLVLAPETPAPATTPAPVAPAPPLKVVAPRDTYSHRPRRSHSAALFIVAVAVLAGGLVIGIASGYTNTGLPWLSAMAPSAAPPVLAPGTSPAAASKGTTVQTASPDQQPESPTNEVPVAEPGKGLHDPAVPPVIPSPVAEAPAAASVAARTGSLDISSNPPGAVVSLDGRVVGQTPLLLRNVPSGSHVMGIEAPGFTRWATSVNVGAGERTRVAASLVGSRQ